MTSENNLSKISYELKKEALELNADAIVSFRIANHVLQTAYGTAVKFINNK
jgi:uncharacterized protein YbjQ (UPF0145 family)